MDTPPANSYPTILGQAYGKAQTEFGLRLAKKVLGQVKTHLPEAMAPQDNLEEIIELGDRVWDVCAKEDKTPMESEQMLFSTLLNVMKVDFGITLELTPTFMLMEEETVKEMMQEELVWHSEMERYKADVYSLSDEACAVGGSPVDDHQECEGKYKKRCCFTIFAIKVLQYYSCKQNCIYYSNRFQRARV
jgi:hypothetical protein